MGTYERLGDIGERLSTLPLPLADRLWGGAQVVILTPEASVDRDHSAHPNDVWVVTPHALEVSWLFTEIAAVAHGHEQVDHLSKYEFYGNLAKAANTALAANPDIDAQSLCRAVLAEAKLMGLELDLG